MSSLPAHDAAHMAPFMPKPMQDMGTNMHHAASQLVIVLQDASITPDAQSMRHMIKPFTKLRQRAPPVMLLIASGEV